MKVIWSKKAVSSLDKYCRYIEEVSVNSAKNVRKKIVLTAGELSKNPEIYQLDEYYPKNTGDIRRFFCWNYRIVYQVREKDVLILNIYQTGLNPGKIK